MQALLTFDAGTRAVYSATYESSGHEFFERGQEFYARFVGERATLHVLQRWLFLCERTDLFRRRHHVLHAAAEAGVLAKSAGLRALFEPAANLWIVPCYEDSAIDLERLIALQRLDSTVRDAERRVTGEPERQKALDARLEEAREKVAAAKQTLADSQTARRAIEAGHRAGRC